MAQEWYAPSFSSAAYAYGLKVFDFFRYSLVVNSASFPIFALGINIIFYKTKMPIIHRTPIEENRDDWHIYFFSKC